MLRTKLLLIVAAVVGLAQVGAIGVTAYLIREDEAARLEERLDRSMRSAATIFELSFPEIAAAFNDAGQVQRLTAADLPTFADHEAVERIRLMTDGGSSSFFAFDPATDDFWRRSTTIINDAGGRAVGTALGLDSPVRAALLRGETFRGQTVVLGVPKVTVYMPIFATEGAEVLGALFVGVETSVYAANIWTRVTRQVVQAAAVLGITVAVLWFVLSRNLAAIGRLGAATNALAGGARDIGVPEQARRDELGAIARGLESLRSNLAASEAASSRAEAEQAQARANLDRMMTDLDREVSSVVQAVGQGDLSRSITTRFDQPELQSLADAVNTLRDRVQGFIGDIGGTLKAMADGDLTHAMPELYAGAFGQIARDANETLDRLSGVLAEVLAAVETNQRGVATIDRASADLGSRVEEQAAALQQTAATMEEMAASVKSNAVSLSEAEAAATSARATTQAGGSAAAAAVEAVGRIAESSSQIAEILKVIDSIAFQTNLLALNAAVEAARAGDAGKGFAVVANEVGNLARQSSEAARDISELVTRNQGSVEEGVEMVQRAGGALGQINDEITRLSQRVAAVSLAGREQSTGIEEVNRAVSGLDQMTQENATLTESTASQVNDLNREMARLAQIVSALRIRSTGPGAAHMRSAA